MRSTRPSLDCCLLASREEDAENHDERSDSRHKLPVLGQLLQQGLGKLKDRTRRTCNHGRSFSRSSDETWAGSLDRRRDIACGPVPIADSCELLAPGGNTSQRLFTSPHLRCRSEHLKGGSSRADWRQAEALAFALERAPPTTPRTLSELATTDPPGSRFHVRLSRKGFGSRAAFGVRWYRRLSLLAIGVLFRPRDPLRARWRRADGCGAW